MRFSQWIDLIGGVGWVTVGLLVATDQLTIPRPEDGIVFLTLLLGWLSFLRMAR